MTLFSLFLCLLPLLVLPSLAFLVFSFLDLLSVFSLSCLFFHFPFLYLLLFSLIHFFQLRLASVVRMRGDRYYVQFRTRT